MWRLCKWCSIKSSSSVVLVSIRWAAPISPNRMWTCTCFGRRKRPSYMLVSIWNPRWMLSDIKSSKGRCSVNSVNETSCFYSDVFHAIIIAYADEEWKAVVWLVRKLLSSSDMIEPLYDEIEWSVLKGIIEEYQKGGFVNDCK